ncbi:hypothetical protein [Saccharopolyspora taberi]|uniref:Uncharacterized protein n=1 Tax=Saccharopolyspora taberi TaxID=60895 RepID=A0ABN3V4Q8_9PSEU
MLCSALGGMTVKAWIALPLLCVGSAIGIAAMLELLISAVPMLDGELSVSAPLLFGFTAAVTFAGSGQVQWRSRLQRRLLRAGYPLAVLAAGLPVDALRLPVVLALAVGPVAIALLTVVLVRGSARRTSCS